MDNLIVICVAGGLTFVSALLLNRAVSRLAQLRLWLEVIRDADERISRDTVRQCAVEALAGKPVHEFTAPSSEP